MKISSWTGRTAMVLSVVGSVGCRNSLLSVENPINIATGAALNSPSGALGGFAAAKIDFINAIAGDQSAYGLLDATRLLTDEFNATGSSFNPGRAFDDRVTHGNGTEYGIFPLLLTARSNLLLTIAPLTTYETGTARGKAGEAEALAGYMEVLLAEDFCNGVTLNEAIPNGGLLLGTPLTGDSLLGDAITHFNTALASAYGADSVTYLASIGLARALMDRGRLSDADTAIANANVPTAFVYDMTTNSNSTNISTQLNANEFDDSFVNAVQEFGGCNQGGGFGPFNMSDREGTNGLNYVSAADPRLVIDSTIYPTCDSTNGWPDTAWYYPLKFGAPPSATYNPLATGVEARLIQAEADLAANSSSGTWLNDLNTLRTSGRGVVDTGSPPHVGPDSIWTLGTGQVPAQTVGLAPLNDPGSDTARVSLLFRERAFWLFGTGTRLGDMRRLIRQYSRPAESVFPTGVYLPQLQPFLAGRNFPATYGTDVSLGLTDFASQEVNPNFKGCTSPPSTP